MRGQIWAKVFAAGTGGCVLSWNSGGSRGPSPWRSPCEGVPDADATPGTVQNPNPQPPARATLGHPDGGVAETASGLQGPRHGAGTCLAGYLRT